ncbi:hypothetical protein [Pelotalea chapellei]|uniref:Uncharacterized protein n=1 Tax=Pelotalea chapellei TaxID=44671 RepID=A0ABS5U6V3_9BACT|nr:hypothetical protein [Pelotalea chapellei]MBT1071397.1 hypothetical protein [Pelotalea chapellei]
MRTTALLNALLASLATVSSAYAAGGREDTSGLFVYIFLGFCALIIALQIMPAILMLFGIIKGVRKETPAEAKAHK